MHENENELTHSPHCAPWCIPVYADETQIPPGKEKMAVQTLREYVAFVNSVENDRIQRKVEAQLGRKIIVLRMALSVENFSLHFTPMACDRMVSDVNVQAAPAASAAEGQK